MERKGKEWNDARNVSMNGYVESVGSESIRNMIADAYREGTEWGSSHPALSAAERGIIDEVIFALKNLGEDRMISYGKEIELLERLRG